MKQLHFCSVALVAVPVISCAIVRSNPGGNELVLSENMKISANTPNGKITIVGRKGFSRHFSCADWSGSTVLTPRRTRWYGSLGAYGPDPGFALGDRLLVDEGRQFFSNESEALRYMKFISGYYGQLTYNNNGLVIAYKIIDIPKEKPSRSIQIWQFYINGEKPSALRGATDENIEITGGTTPDKATPISAPIGYNRELSDKEYIPNK